MPMEVADILHPGKGEFDWLLPTTRETTLEGVTIRIAEKPPTPPASGDHRGGVNIPKPVNGDALPIKRESCPARRTAHQRADDVLSEKGWSNKEAQQTGRSEKRFEEASQKSCPLCY